MSKKSSSLNILDRASRGSTNCHRDWSLVAWRHRHYRRHMLLFWRLRRMRPWMLSLHLQSGFSRLTFNAGVLLYTEWKTLISSCCYEKQPDNVNIITQPQVVSDESFNWIVLLAKRVHFSRENNLSSKLIDKIVNDDRAPLTTNAVTGTNNVNYEPAYPSLS